MSGNLYFSTAGVRDILIQLCPESKFFTSEDYGRGLLVGLYCGLRTRYGKQTTEKMILDALPPTVVRGCIPREWDFIMGTYVTVEGKPNLIRRWVDACKC